MPIMQTLNPKTKAYVKFKKLASGKVKFLDTKQRKPSKPFKGIKIV